MLGMRKFSRDTRGQVGVIFALSVLPLTALTSAAIDYSSATKEQNAISIALDAAVLAAANNNAIPDSEKHTYAETHFLENYHGNVALDLTSGIESDRVSLSAAGVFNLTFGNVIGIKDLKLSERSAASIANENTICLLALNETAAQSILFDGGINYSSPTCAVYANSTHETALESRSLQNPEAKSFCSVGGARGEFTPYVKGECKTVVDPYAETAAPLIPDTCEVPLNELIVFKDNSLEALSARERAKLKKALRFAVNTFEETGSLRSAVEAFFSYERDPVYDVDLNGEIEVSRNRTGSDVDIKPGVFCGGLTIDGINVDFLPGEYIIKDGPLSFVNGAEAVAKDVTFVLSGSGAVLNIQSQSSLLLKAPSIGVRKGVAGIEAVDHSAPANRTVEEKNSLIAEGGSLQVTGTVYLPQQQLKIMGKNTAIGSMAPATSFIADTLHISGGTGARMDIGVDHVEAGVPPIQPRAEDGARLVQ